LHVACSKWNEVIAADPSGQPLVERGGVVLTRVTRTLLEKVSPFSLAVAFAYDRQPKAGFGLSSSGRLIT